MFKLNLTLGILQLLLYYSAVDCVSFEEDVTITMRQKAAVDKLRQSVSPFIVEDYMKEDIYLVKWLRSANFDIRKAEKLMIENIRWRKEQKMVTIDKEDFSDVSDDYPFFNEGFDKEGRPLFVGFAGEWDIRKAIVTGKWPRLRRYLDQQMELVARRIRKLQQEGRNVTQSVLLIDLGQFSLVTHGCAQCLLRIVQFLNSYESHFPGLGHKVFFTNAPPTIAVALELVRATVSKETNAAIEVYGTNKQQVEKVLGKQIDKKWLPTEWGGTWERN